MDETKIKQLIGELILTVYNQNEQIARLKQELETCKQTQTAET